MGACSTQLAAAVASWQTDSWREDSGSLQPGPVGRACLDAIDSLAMIRPLTATLPPCLHTRHALNLLIICCSSAFHVPKEEVDRKMIELDGTDNKSKLGANGILAVSLAVARVRRCGWGWGWGWVNGGWGCGCGRRWVD